MSNDLMPVFLQNLDAYEMVDKNHRILIAVSGGPDSMALLHLFFRWDKTRIGVFHLNHGFRPTASRDADLVREFCHQRGIPVHICVYDVTAYLKRTGESKQQGARHVRYKLLVDYAKKNGYHRIAFAHHGDDQAETVLMRLLRGTGLHGLGGIPPVRDMYIRPLINVYKDAIVRYCDTFGVPYAEDETNMQPIYFRNKIRHQLIPLLEKEYNPQIRAQLVQLAELVREDEEELQKAVDKLCQDHMEYSGSQVIFDRNVFHTLSVAMQRRVLRALLYAYRGDLLRIDFTHIESWRQHLLENSSFQLQLPQVSVSAAANSIFVGPFPLEEWQSRVLDVPGQHQLGGFTITVECFSKDDLPERPHNAEDFDEADLQLPLYVRPREPGDRMQPFGSERTKKVKDILIDAKVPRQLRDYLPLITDERQIIWIPTVRRSEIGRLSEKTQRVIRIIYKGPGG